MQAWLLSQDGGGDGWLLVSPPQQVSPMMTTWHRAHCLLSQWSRLASWLYTWPSDDEGVYNKDMKGKAVINKLMAWLKLNGQYSSKCSNNGQLGMHLGQTWDSTQKVRQPRFFLANNFIRHQHKMIVCVFENILWGLLCVYSGAKSVTCSESMFLFIPVNPESKVRIIGNIFY